MCFEKLQKQKLKSLNLSRKQLTKHVLPHCVLVTSYGDIRQGVGFLGANGDIYLGKIDSGNGTKPLPEQMLTCLVFTWKQFHNECPSHYSVNEFEVELLKSKPRLPRANELTCLKSMQDPKWISRLDWSSCDNRLGQSREIYSNSVSPARCRFQHSSFW